MRYLALGAVLASTSVPALAQDETLAPPGCDYGQPHPEAPAQMSQFDFLIGDYAISIWRWIDNDWQQVPPQFGQARWNGRYILGGMAIMDEWFNKDPGIDPNAVRGVNVRMFDPNRGEWDMMWNYTGTNQVQDLRARMIGDRMTMWQHSPNRPDFRAYFERLGDDSWHRITLMRDAEGNFQKTTRLLATRIPCPD